jgi:hypothetical protein
VQPAAGFVRVNAAVTGIPAGERCRIIVEGLDGTQEVAGSWVVSEKGAAEGAAIDGSAMIDVSNVKAVLIENADGRQFASGRLVMPMSPASCGGAAPHRGGPPRAGPCATGISLSRKQFTGKIKASLSLNRSAVIPVVMDGWTECFGPAPAACALQVCGPPGSMKDNHSASGPTPGRSSAGAP